jgi:hypothetical protein
MPVLRSRVLCVLAGAVLQVACGGSSTDGPSLLVATTLDRVQCQPQSGRRVSTVTELLSANGIAAVLQGCTIDGNLYGSACGNGTGALVVYEIGTHKLTAAQALGFAPTSAWPRIRPVSQCPAE